MNSDYSGSSRNLVGRAHRNDLALGAVDDCLQVIGPKQQRGPDLALIARAVVDAGDAALVARPVIEHALDDVRLHAEFGHASCDRAPDIVDAPGRQPPALGLDDAGAERERAIAP